MAVDLLFFSSDRFAIFFLPGALCLCVSVSRRCFTISSLVPMFLSKQGLGFLSQFELSQVGLVLIFESEEFGLRPEWALH